MTDEKKTPARVGAGIIRVITAILFALKFAGLTQISWILVFTPLLAWLGLIVAVLLIAAVITGIATLAKKD